MLPEIDFGVTDNSWLLYLVARVERVAEETRIFVLSTRLTQLLGTVGARITRAAPEALIGRHAHLQQWIRRNIHFRHLVCRLFETLNVSFDGI